MTHTLPLANGLAIPQLGLGVYQAGSGEQCRAAVRTALQLGYRHIDTAALYGNEADVGAAVREIGIPRAEIFVTTKLWNDAHGYEPALRAFEDSRRRLGLEQVDLYLIHWPVPGRRAESWRALETLLEDGRARSIGVSNYMVPHLDELVGQARVAPMVNQIELHPFLQHRETRAWCAEHGVVVEAYSPLTRAQRLRHPVVVEVARSVGRTSAQVLLRWGVQKGLVVLPKSVRAQRIAENAAIFDWALDDAAMERLDALDQGLATGWDPRRQR